MIVFRPRLWLIALLGAALLLMGVRPVHAAWRSLTGVLPPHADIASGWAISPDSRYVVFVADIDTDGQNELYSVAITGTVPLKLNPTLVAGGRVDRFAFTPDGQSVIYTADQEVDSRIELYQVPIGGGPSVKLNGPLVAGGNILTFKVDPDGARVVYQADQTTNEVPELYSAPLGGGSWVKLNGALVSGGRVLDAFQVEPISNRVVYQAYQEVSNRLELYSVPIAGGTVTKLNEPGATVEFTFQVNPSLQVVVFAARPSGSSIVRLYMNAAAGGLLTELSFALASNQDVFGYRISPTGDRVIYNVTTNPGSGFVGDGNLYSVLIGGGTSTLLTTAADPGFGVFGATFLLTENNQRVVYRYQRNASSAPVLESVSITGGNRATLYAATSTDPFFSFRLSSDSQWVVYQTGSATGTLYAIPPGGGSPSALGSGFFQQIAPDSSRVFYTSNLPSGAYDVYSQQIFGGGLRNLSRVGPQAQVLAVQVSADSQWVVYEVEGLGDTDATELRVSDGGEAQPPLQYIYLPAIERR